MRNVLNNLNAFIAGWILLVSISPLALAQQVSGTIQISGRVSPALKLSVGSIPRLTDGIQAVVEAQGPGFIQIGLRGDGQGEAPRLTIPLELRTNVGYELNLTLLSTSGCQPGLAASIGSIRASGAAVKSGAAETSRRANAIDRLDLNNQVTLLIGPRVSARGNFATAGNALLVDLNIAGTENSGSACPWRASLRISLHPSASF
jgi:hypothetical protein